MDKRRRVIFGGKWERCTCLLKKMRFGPKGGKGLTCSWAKNSCRRRCSEQQCTGVPCTPLECLSLTEPNSSFHKHGSLRELPVSPPCWAAGQRSALELPRTETPPANGRSSSECPWTALQVTPPEQGHLSRFLT